jgi:alpha-ketoglutarate-dependent 2,4-dichlorophenoxyacetate dioxygenase
MSMKIQRLDAPFGCEVLGLDINSGVSKNDYLQVRAAFETYSVVVIRGAPLSDASQIEFSEMFGPCEKTLKGNPAAGSVFARQSNLDINTGDQIPAEDRRMFYQKANMLWHADSAFKPRASLCSILSARIIPSAGGATEVASTRLAYDALDENLKTTIDPLIAEYSLVWSRGLIGYEFNDEERSTMHKVRHPLVRENPVNQKKSMLIGAHAMNIEGWEQANGLKLLNELLSHATQQKFCYRHEWREGDVLIWDNRACVHRATPYDSNVEKRLMQRTTIGDLSEEAFDPKAVAA